MTTRVKFGDVVKLSKERSSNPEADGYERYIGLEHIDPGELRVRRWGDIADGVTFTSVFKPGQVLFGKRRAYQRKVAVADFSGVCSGDIYVLEPKNDALLPELLPFICQTDAFFDHAVGTSAGSLSPRTNWKSLATFEFDLPPIEEQRQMVDRIAIFDKSVDTMRNAWKRLLKVKQSLLVELFPPDSVISGADSLQSFVDRKLIDFQTGPFGTVLSAKEYTESGWPIINPTDMRHGEISHQDGPCVPEDTAQRLAKYRMTKGDILLARKGEIDKACLARAEHEGWIVGSDCIRIRCEQKHLSSEYLLYFLQSPGSARLLLSHAHGTVMPGLNEKMLGQLRLSLPENDEQDQAVAALSQLDEKLIHIRSRVDASSRFRNEVLNKLLEGVPNVV
jgi:type I restriction enzyme S subunit